MFPVARVRVHLFIDSGVRMAGLQACTTSLQLLLSSHFPNLHALPPEHLVW